jgi:outer membrane putative beta-barrel porin/alpha-amylase
MAAGLKGPRSTMAAILWVVMTLLAARVTAQDMEPKAYSASPVGANFLVVGYSGSVGSVLIDPTLPITDVDAHVGGVFVGLGHTFNLFGKLALASASLPYSWANVTGKIQEQAAETHRSGLADGRFKVSINLRGNDAMAPREFATAPRRTVIGASVTVAAPAGQYYETKLVNLGTNRWGYKPEVGISFPIGKWDLDAYGGAWFFTDNPAFYPGGLVRSQSPVVAIQAHGSYSFRRQLWIAADGTWYSGGSATVEGGEPSASMNNSRVGLTASLPFGTNSSIKVSYTTGMVVRTGTNFKTVAVAWQKLWLSPRWSGR